MNFLSWLLVIGFFNLATSSNNCVFNDCQCASKNNKDLYIYCSSINMFPLRRIKNIPIKIDILSMNGNNFSTIPDNSFNGLTIEYLTLSYNNFTKLTAGAFRNLNGLKKLRILEPAFREIEVGALQPLKSSLVDLEVFKLDLKDVQLNRFMNEVKQLTHLRSISFVDMGIATFSHEWIQNFPGLESLSLASNSLQTLPDNLFVEATRKLRVLDLTGNLISNLGEVLTALAPVRPTLQELILGQNRIEFMHEFSGFAQLRVLDLSHNRIKVIGATQFRGMKSLQNVYFAWNAIEIIDESSFEGLENLLYLDLSGNYLDQVPPLRSLKSLMFFDISEQHGMLKSIGDYAFDRQSPSNYLSINANLNQIERFDKKSFCLRGADKNSTRDSKIKQLKISLSSIRNVDKCIFKQIEPVVDGLVQAELKVEVPIKMSRNEGDYDNVCNCSLMGFLRMHRIELGGQCSPLRLMCQRRLPDSTVDDCSQEYSC